MYDSAQTIIKKRLATNRNIIPEMPKNYNRYYIEGGA